MELEPWTDDSNQTTERGTNWTCTCWYVLTHSSHKERQGEGENCTAHLIGGFDLIPIFICFTGEIHLSQYHWAAGRYSHFCCVHAQADESRGGSCFPHLYRKIKGSWETQRGSKASQTEGVRWEKTSAFGARTVKKPPVSAHLWFLK